MNFHKLCWISTNVSFGSLCFVRIVRMFYLAPYNRDHKAWYFKIICSTLTSISEQKQDKYCEIRAIRRLCNRKIPIHSMIWTCWYVFYIQLPMKRGDRRKGLLRARSWGTEQLFSDQVFYRMAKCAFTDGERLWSVSIRWSSKRVFVAWWGTVCAYAYNLINLGVSVLGDWMFPWNDSPCDTIVYLTTKKPWR